MLGVAGGGAVEDMEGGHGGLVVVWGLCNEFMVVCIDIVLFVVGCPCWWRSMSRHDDDACARDDGHTCFGNVDLPLLQDYS